MMVASVTRGGRSDSSGHAFAGALPASGELVPVRRNGWMESLRARFAVLVPERLACDLGGPPGCHCRRVPDRIVFDKGLKALWVGRFISGECGDTG